MKSKTGEGVAWCHELFSTSVISETLYFHNIVWEYPFCMILEVTMWTSVYLTNHVLSIKIDSTLKIVITWLGAQYTYPLTSVKLPWECGFYFLCWWHLTLCSPLTKDAFFAFDKLNKCLEDVRDQMLDSKLKLIHDKTEFCLFFIVKTTN